MEKMRIKANGVELQVEQYPRNGQAVIFIHFSGGNLAQWNGIIPFFMEKYHVVTLDIRGHGKSEKPKTGYTLDNMARDVIEVMNQLEIDRAHIVGSSLGGEIAASLAANFPDRILSIVTECAFQNYFGPNGVWDISAEEIPKKKIELRAKRAEKINPVFDSIARKIEAEKQNYEQGGIKWNQRIEEFEMYDTVKAGESQFTCSCPKWVMDQYEEDFWDIKFEKYFEKIGCPVLILPGEEDRESEGIKASQENFQKILKLSKIVFIPGGNNAYVAFQYPKEFSKVILDFYEEIEKNIKIL